MTHLLSFLTHIKTKIPWQACTLVSGLIFFNGSHATDASPSSPPSSALTLAVSDTVKVCLSLDKTKPYWLHCEQTLPEDAVDSRLAQSLKHAEKLVHLATHFQERSKHFLLLARIPSNRGNPMGFCGAGREELLVLVAYEQGRIRYLDEFLLQSCLQSISLQSAAPDQSISYIDLQDEKQRLTFHWMALQADGHFALHYGEGRFLLEPIEDY